MVLPMTQVFETQADRTDLPLVAMPAVLDAMIEPIKAQFPVLHDIARVRMFEDFTSDEDVLLERAKGASVLLIGGYHISDVMLRRLADEGIRCLVFCGTGVSSYVNLDLARELNMRVCNAEHYGDNAVAELTFALIFELIRRVGSLDAAVKRGEWAWIGGDGLQLAGKRLGIIGLGGIGATVARIATAFGMRVSAWSAHVPDTMFDGCGATPVADLGELIEQSDVVSVHLPLLEGEHGTSGIITAEHLEHLRPGTLFVNTARAEVIEPGALLARLERGDIPAALDVYDHEPLGADDPLCWIPGLVLTPHVGWRTDGAFADLTRQMIACTAAFLTGEKFNVVVAER